MALMMATGSFGETGAARARRDAVSANRPDMAVRTNARRVIMEILKSVSPCLWTKTRPSIMVGCASPSPGEYHGKRKRPQHQEKAEMQELRGQGPAEEGRQGRQMPALRRDRFAVARIPQRIVLRSIRAALVAPRQCGYLPDSVRWR